jgi:dienelactone hydrolase
MDLAPRFPVVPGRTWQEVSYLGAAGDRIPALFRPARRPGRRPAVILGHGHGGDAGDMAGFFGPSLGRGVHVLAVNHPFHGRGRRKRGEDICPPDAERLVERWILAVRDLRHALRVLAARPDVDQARIGYLGFSLGGCLGALFAAHEPRLRAAALVAPAADWKLLAASDSAWHLGFGGQPLGAWLGVPRLASRLAVIDPARSIARFAPRPLLVVVGENDRVIRASSGKALHLAAGAGKELLLHPGGHGPGEALRTRVGRWLEGKLGAQALSPSEAPPRRQVN